MKNLFIFITILIILIINNNCSDKTTYSGKIINLENINYKEFANKNELIQTLGKPDYVDPIEKKYYYFSEKRINKNFFNNKLNNRILIVYQFNSDETLLNFLEYNLSDEKDVSIIKNTTPNLIVKQGLLEKIFGGVGKANIPQSQ